MKDRVLVKGIWPLREAKALAETETYVQRDTIADGQNCLRPGTQAGQVGCCWPGEKES